MEDTRTYEHPLLKPNPRIEPTYVHQDKELGPHDHALVPLGLADVDEDRARILAHRANFNVKEHLAQEKRQESERLAAGPDYPAEPMTDPDVQAHETKRAEQMEPPIEQPIKPPAEELHELDEEIAHEG